MAIISGILRIYGTAILLIGILSGIASLFFQPLVGLGSIVVAIVFFISCFALANEAWSALTWVLFAVSLCGVIIVVIAVFQWQAARPQVCIGFSNPNCGGNGDPAAMATATGFIVTGGLVHILTLIGAAISLRFKK